jgi:hypothetical protein
MKLSIIIVNYKTPALVLDCIRSVHRYDTNGIEIIVVDNDSGDNLEEMLKQQYPAVLFTAMGYNSGFARANNKGISMAIGKAVLLLNSDTIVQDDAVNKACDQLLASEYVACGVQLLNTDGTPQISGNYAMRGGLNYLLPLPYTGGLVKLMGNLFGIKKPNVPNATGVVEVDWINGAFLMVKRSAIQKAGLLDEDFFLYAEEAEWCSRLKKQGKLCVFGTEHVIHLQGATANDTFGSEGKGYYNLYDKKGLQIMLSNFVRIRKQFGVFWLITDFFFYLFTIPVFFLVLVLSRIFFVRSAFTFRHLQRFTKNVFLLLSYLPRIIKNKPYFYKVL